MNGLRAGSICTGYGGLDMAVHEVLSGELAWVADIDADASLVLAHRFPGVPNLGDITAVDWSSAKPVDVLTAGTPCFAAGTRILTARGWIPIEEVRVGDLVLTHAGRWQRVTAVGSKVSDHTVTVRGQGIPQIMTTEEHPFYTRSYRHVWKHRGPGGTTREFSEPGWTVAAKLKGQFIGQVLPPVEDDPGNDDLWWLVGRYLADGWITTGTRGPDHHRKRVVICCAHGEADELAERIRRVVPATRTSELTVTKFTVYRAWFADFLAPLGRGAAGKTLTRRELALPPGKADALLSGWLSGDGCRTQGAWKGTSVSRSLALSMALLAQRARNVVASLNETAVFPSTVIAGRSVAQRTQYQVVIRDRNRSAITDGNYGWKLVRDAARTDSPTLVCNLSVAVDESYIADGAIVHNCQDVSQAGARAGLRHGTRSGVWHEAVRAIAELRPSLVVIENVLGLLTARGDEPTDEHLAAERNRDAARSLLAWVNGAYEVAVARGETERARKCLARAARVMGCLKRAVARCRWHEQRLVRAVGTVLGTLASLGFDAEWAVLSAADAGACHLRKRIFIIAWPAEDSYRAASGQRRLAAPGQAEGGGPRADTGRPGGAPAADAAGARCGEGQDAGAGGGDAPAGTGAGEGTGRVQPERGSGGRDAPADADIERLGADGGTAHGHEAVDRTEHAEPARGGRADARAGGPGPAAADADGDGLAGGTQRDIGAQRPEADHEHRRVDPRGRVLDWGPYGASVARWESALGRPAPPPTDPGKTGDRLSPRFVEWMMGLPEGWVTVVPGLSRNAQLRILGNGVVPAQAEMALRLLLARAGLAEAGEAA